MVVAAILVRLRWPVTLAGDGREAVLRAWQYRRRWPRHRDRYVCRDCGHEALAWSGQCAGCGEWNTLDEVVVAGHVRARPGGGGASPGAAAPRSVPLRDVAAPREERLATGIGELDRVLGGGLVPGSLVLLGGSPGIGKSHDHRDGARQHGRRRPQALYVTGEESAAQVRMRAERLGEGALDVPALAETDLDDRRRARSRPSGPTSASSTRSRRCTRAELSSAPGLGRARCARRPTR